MPEEVLTIGSYALTLADQAQLVERIVVAQKDPEIDGIVVTHGTDSMEETAFLADLVAAGSTPIVFTGAQRTADLDSPDGPRNLAESIILAGREELRGHGVMIYFSGLLLGARGTLKSHTIAPRPFSGGRVIGEFYNGVFTAQSTEPPQRAFVPYEPKIGEVRVDIHSTYPGSDPQLLLRAREYGADAFVIAGMGMGNMHPGYVPVITELIRQGLPVVLSTRVPEGPIIPTYGKGGAGELVGLGVIVSQLNPFQSRIALAAGLAAGYSNEELRGLFQH